MRAEPAIPQGPNPQLEADRDAELQAAELISELANAGLVSIRVHDDGEVSYALTRSGRQSARQMAMSREAHALVLLGALVSQGQGPN